MSTSATTPPRSDEAQQQPVHAALACLYNTGKAMSALISFNVVLTDLSNGAPRSDYTLSVTASHNPAPLLTKRIVFQESVLDLWLAVNSHLIPNGPTEISFSLSDGAGKTLWRDSVALTIANTSPLAEKVRKSLRSFGTPVVIDGPCDSTMYDYQDESLTPWFDREDAFEHIDERLAKGEISEAEAGQLQDFLLNGYMILENVLGEALVQQINSEIDDAVAKKVEGYEYGSSQRIHNLHHMYPGVRQLWKHPQILRLLSLIFESQARPCQSLTYVFGSEQPAHQDTVHLTSFPAGYMCGVWIALEDIQPNSGELEVFKGTHRLPRVYVSNMGLGKSRADWSAFNGRVLPLWRRMIEAGGFEKVTYRPKRGTVLIWHENLLHGGGIRKDKSLTRRSIVTHNFADGSIAYYDSTGLVGYMEPTENLK